MSKAWGHKVVKLTEAEIMNTEELLKPRYKVIADYPDSDYRIGFIIENIGPNYCEWLNKFPHLFKPLQWWEERKESDMPQYVKVTHDDSVSYLDGDIYDENAKEIWVIYPPEGECINTKDGYKWMLLAGCPYLISTTNDKIEIHAMSLYPSSEQEYLTQKQPQ